MKFGKNKAKMEVANLTLKKRANFGLDPEGSRQSLKYLNWN